MYNSQVSSLLEGEAETLIREFPRGHASELSPPAPHPTPPSGHTGDIPAAGGGEGDSFHVDETRNRMQGAPGVTLAAGRKWIHIFKILRRVIFNIKFDTQPNHLSNVSTEKQRPPNPGTQVCLPHAFLG